MKGIVGNSRNIEKFNPESPNDSVSKLKVKDMIDSPKRSSIGSRENNSSMMMPKRNSLFKNKGTARKGSVMVTGNSSKPMHKKNLSIDNKK